MTHHQPPGGEEGGEEGGGEGEEGEGREEGERREGEEEGGRAGEGGRKEKECGSLSVHTVIDSQAHTHAEERVYG